MSDSPYEVEKNRILPLMKQRQYPQALSLLESLRPENSEQKQELLELQALCYYRTEMFEQAGVCYQQLCEENPRSTKPLVNLGVIYNRLQKYGEAIETFRKALQYDKACADAYYNLGVAQKHSGRLDLAISAYKEALKLNPKLEQAYLNLANIYLSQNNTVMATNYYRLALNLNAELQAAQRGLKLAGDLEAKNRILASPFGRLVDVTQLAHQKTACATRTLSDSEREKDREEVLRLVKGIRNAARHVSEELREKIQPALLALTRSLVDGENRPSLVAENQEKFQRELRRFQEGRRYLKRCVLELRGHEEFMNTPDWDEIENFGG